MKIMVAYSGGKDSQACLLWSVEQFGAKNIEAVFCDTGWENPITYDHIIKTTQDLGVKIITVKSKKYDGLVDMAEKKGRFPSTKARFCTVELKSIPFIDYVLDQKDHITVIQGIRSQESHSRSLMQKQCRYFKYYFEPYRTNTMQIDAIEAKEKPTKADLKRLPILKQRVSEGKEDAKFHTYRKKEIKAWCEKYSDDILRPVFDWSGQEVIDYIIEKGQQPNELYKQGFKRVGCFPCIMSGHKEVYQLMTRYPEKFDEIIEHEARIGSSFFKIDFIPKHQQSGVCDRTGKKFTTGEDVRKYLNNKNMSGDLFLDDKAISCSSYYHLCE